MSQSSKDPDMIANGTILGIAPMKTNMFYTGAVVVLLFTLIRPEITAEMSFLPRLMFWILHVGCGLVGIVFASKIIRRVASTNIPVLINIGVTGILGAMLASPAYFSLELFYPPGPPDDWLDFFEDRSLLHGLIGEFISILPTVLLFWYIINIPLIFNKTLYNPPSPPDQPDDPPEDEKTRSREEKITYLRERIPEAIGTDIVAISSDLHYLNVHTTLGKTLILGSLKEYAEAFGDLGMMTHRSHWVMKHQVQRVHIAGKAANCIMKTGLKVPISRSKRKEIKDYFGQSTTIPKSGNISALKKVG